MIAAFSAGSFEEDRPDAADFEEAWLGEEKDDGGSGERWLNITAEVCACGAGPCVVVVPLATGVPVNRLAQN